MPNENILEYLRTCHANESLAHAYLLLGPKDSGRMELLEVFLGELVGKEGLTHPDVRMVSLEEEKSAISIEQIRALREWLGHSPIKAGAKAAVIERAELMNHEAQNALLKSLEEPVPNTYLFLLAGHRHQLLPTVVSRTVPLTFSSYHSKPRHSEPRHPELVSGSASVSESVLPSENRSRPSDSAGGMTSGGTLINQLFSAPDMHERMRQWIKAGLEKEEVPALLIDSVPILRSRMITAVEENNFQKAKTLARAIRALHVALARPVGQNWGLVFENVIVVI